MNTGQWNISQLNHHDRRGTSLEVKRKLFDHLDLFVWIVLARLVVVVDRVNNVIIFRLVNPFGGKFGCTRTNAACWMVR